MDLATLMEHSRQRKKLAKQQKAEKLKQMQMSPAGVALANDSARRLNATQAKSLFFLTSADLKGLAHELRGSSRLYSETALLTAAHQKHGQVGLEKKRAARDQRSAQKRRREERHEDAEMPGGIATASKRLHLENYKPDSPTFQSQLTDEQRAQIATKKQKALDKLAAREVGTEEELQQYRIDGLAQITAAMRAHMTWDLLRQHQSRHGLWCTSRIHNFPAAWFSALTAKTGGTCYRGGWHTAHVPPATLYQSAGLRLPRGIGGMYQGNTDLSISPCDDVELKYSPGSEVLCVGGHIGPVPTQIPGYGR